MGRPIVAWRTGSTAGLVGAALIATALVIAGCGTTASTPTASSSGPTTVRTPTCPPGPASPAPKGTGAATRAGLADELVPPGAVAVVVCRYLASSTSAVRSVLVPRRDVAALVAELDSGAWQVIAHPATYFCPMWDGSTDQVRLAYPSGPDVTVTVDLGGCGFASNGVRTVNGYQISGYLVRWVGTGSATSPPG